MTPVYAITSIFDDDAGLLPHFVKHYTRLGVDRLFIAVCGEPDSPLGIAAAKAANAAQLWPVTLSHHPGESMDDDAKERRERGILDAAGVGPDDYVLRVDLDEFQVYPAPLAEIVAAMDAQNEWAARGWLVDRVAADGSLPPVDPLRDLGEQFPVACRMTEAVGRTECQKIVIARHRVHLTRGSHHAVDAVIDRCPAGFPGDWLVHHFKWHAALVRRMDWLADHRPEGGHNADAYHRFRNYLRNNGGKINVKDAWLQPRRLGPLYAPETLMSGSSPPVPESSAERYADARPPQYSNDWFTWNTENWAQLFLKLAGKPGLTAIEVGSFEGRSARWLLENVLTDPAARLYCVDTWSGGPGTPPFQVDDVWRRFVRNVLDYPGGRVTPLRGPSVPTLAGLVRDGVRVDLAYVDGSHYGPDVLADAVLCWQLLKPGGLLVFDDYQWPAQTGCDIPPAPAIDAFLSLHRNEVEGIDRGRQVCCRKRDVTLA